MFLCVSVCSLNVSVCFLNGSVNVYRVGELQSRVDQRQKLVIQARFQADDVVDDSLFYLNKPITEQMGSDMLVGGLHFYSVFPVQRQLKALYNAPHSPITDDANCSSRAIWGSVSCSRTLRNAARGDRTGDHPITRQPRFPVCLYFYIFVTLIIVTERFLACLCVCVCVC